MVSMVIISLYSVFTLFWLTHKEFLPDNEGVDKFLLAEIDSYFLTIFFSEIVLKSFASNMMYLKDAFNMFDAIIVVISEVLNVI